MQTARLIAFSCLIFMSKVFGHEICLSSDGKKQPLVFDSHNVIYPSATCGQGGSGELFQSVKRLQVACIGTNNNVVSYDGIQTLAPGSTAMYVPIALSDGGARISCLSVNKATVIRDPESDVDGQCRAFKTGFNVPNLFAPFFHTVFTVCWNETYQHPMWVRNPINPGTVSETSVEEELVDTAVRAKFRFSRTIFGRDYNPKRYYSIAHQRAAGLIHTATGSDFYARGHLAPAGDFFLAAERWATFSLENAVPQLQSHNNGAWKEIETEARHIKQAYVAETGPLYRCVDGIYHEYLDTDHNLIPIPIALYKIVYNKQGKELYRGKSKMLPHIN